MDDVTTEFDGCNSECRKAAQHTLRWGGCELAPEPDPTLGILRVRCMPDGENGIVTDQYTVTELAARIEVAMRTVTIRFGALGEWAFERQNWISDSEYAALARAVANDLIEGTQQPMQAAGERR